ncbi:hypothetical protein [Bathymodiolus japonicus methanotrophic gill symbiont]|uniref:hypothetical protein n=1 Tax=Bathymodiolus japonicus methanotrophic gill symbiont TaxID=113269 RepID=UPI001C8E89CA|nr:hypothetical protein [Bathymodiolus japonicus methanotrophic gill symbiont]
MRSRCGRRAFRASPIRCVGERIMATGVPEFREVAWRACFSCPICLYRSSTKACWSLSCCFLLVENASGITSNT